MLTFFVEKEGSNITAVEQLVEEPDYVVTTDFEEIGIKIGKHSNESMKLAIDAVTMLTNCGVLSIREV